MKKVYKYLLILLSILLILFSVSYGCDKAGKTLHKINDSQDFPVVITDSLGRNVEIDDKPERITSGYYISTYMLLNLGLKNQIVGIESKADTRNFYKFFAPELIKLPDVGTAKAVNIETIMSLKPDLVVLPYHQAEIIEKFELVNIPAILVEPETLDNMLYVFDFLSKATGTTQRAATIIEWYKSSWAELESKTGNLQKKSVYLCSNSDPLNTLTPKMFQADMIKAAGGKLVTSDIEETYWAKISMEQLFVYKPEFVFISSGSNITPQKLLEDQNWKKLMGDEQNIFNFSDTVDQWDNPSLSSVLGAYFIASKLHPEVITEEDIIKKAKEYYNLVFNVDISKEQLGL